MWTPYLPFQNVYVFVENVIKNVKHWKLLGFSTTFNFGVISRNVCNIKLHMSLSENLLDTELLLNVYTIPIPEQVDKKLH